MPHAQTAFFQGIACTSDISAHTAARIAGVCKRFGDVNALEDLSLEIRRGEILGLLGPNGAGKSTLMQLLCGLLCPDDGEIAIGNCGRPARRRSRRALGFAPQVSALYPQLTAAENLRFFARLHGVAGRDVERRVRFGLELADLADRRHHRVATFSGGMLRRLNLACAILHGPELLLLDEPTAGVDPQSRHHLVEAIAGLQREGLTILCTTHLIDEAERLCDRIAIIDGGRLRALGSSAELCRAYAGDNLQAAFLAITGKELRD